MILDQRVIHQGNDISMLVNDFRSGTYTFPYQTGQYLYFGSILPFNNLWFELGTVNAVAAEVSIDMWWGGSDGWVPAVDILDQTAGLTQSGRLQWTTDMDKGWNHELRSADVTGLSLTKIYNMYWLRLSWDATLTPTTQLKYIGQKFSDDTVLRSFYPDLLDTQIMTAFTAGKTNWTEQHYMAAEHIVRDLKKRNIIKARAQLLDYSLFVDAACHKVAELAYTSFGQPYFEAKKVVSAAYDQALNMKFFHTDLDANGRLDPQERYIQTGFMER